MNLTYFVTIHSVTDGPYAIYREGINRPEDGHFTLETTVATVDADILTFGIAHGTPARLNFTEYRDAQDAHHYEPAPDRIPDMAWTKGKVGKHHVTAYFHLRGNPLYDAANA